MNVIGAYFLLRSLQKNRFRIVLEGMEWKRKFSILNNQPMPKYQLPENLKDKFK